jgi:hypothetical protein
LQINILKPGVTLTHFVTAARQGSLYEAFNMAMLGNYLLFYRRKQADGNICRKNGEPFRYLEMGLGYEMPCGPVDGMNLVLPANDRKQLKERVVVIQHFEKVHSQRSLH